MSGFKPIYLAPDHAWYPPTEEQKGRMSPACREWRPPEQLTVNNTSRDSSTTHNHNFFAPVTNNNYYAAPSVSQASTSADDGGGWLPKEMCGTRTTTYTKRVRPEKGESYVKQFKVTTSMTRRGRITKACNQHRCPRKCEPMTKFRTRNSKRDLKAYNDALRNVAEAIDAKDADALDAARSVLEQLASTRCDVCRDGKAKTTRSESSRWGQCRAFWEAWKKNNVCVGCGTNRCIEGDHGSNPKVHQLSAWPWWSWNGGVPAMEEEAKKLTPRCRACHTLEDTGKAGVNRRGINPEDLPKVRPSEDKRAYSKRRNAAIKYERLQYDAEEKRKIKFCENLDCPRDGPTNGEVVEGKTQCFDWHHTNEACKLINISAIVGYPKKMPFDEWKDWYHGERDGDGDCRMLCTNCHHETTHHGLVIRYAPKKR